MNIKRMKKCILPIVVVLLLVAAAQAEFVDTVVLTPAISHFEVHDTYNVAHTYPNGPDIWDFDLSAFTDLVIIDLKVDDFYTGWPDDYDLYWDASFLGNTQSAYDGWEFNFVTTPVTHSLTIDYVNQFSGWPTSGGGSYYDLWIDAELVPVPGAILLGILGLGVAGLKLRKFA